MPMSKSDIDDLKSQLAAAKKHPFNFGACLATKPEDTVMVLHRTKEGTALAKQAKAVAGAGKLVSGSLTLDGKVVRIKTDKEVAGVVGNLVKMLRKNGMMFSVETHSVDDVPGAMPDPTEDESDTDNEVPDQIDGPHPRQGDWDRLEQTLAPQIKDSLSRLDDASKLRAAWNYALAAASDGDIPTAIKAGERLTDALKVALKAHGKATLQKAVGLMDQVKSGLSDGDRKTLRDLVAGMADNIGKVSAADIEARYDAYVKKLRELAKTARADAEGSEKAAKRETSEAVATIQTSIDRLTRELEAAEKKVNSTTAMLTEAKKRLNGPNRPKAKAAEKLATRISSLEEEVDTETSALNLKRGEITPMIDELRKTQGDAAKLLDVKLSNIGSRMDALKKARPTNDFKEVHAALNATIKDQAEAMEWREGRDGEGGEIRRGDAEGHHGSTRHGAQSGVDRQARRAATGGFTPDEPNSADPARRSGVTTSMTSWKGATIEWEEVGGKRKVKSRTELQKQIVAEVGNFVPPKDDRNSSMFATPVLEKKAVDTAIGIMNAKGWNEIYSNAKNWHDLTSVTLVIGPPAGYSGWGYTLTRKEAATITLNAANAILKEFEDGTIDEAAMLSRLGVEYLMKDGVVKMTPYATVVLVRDNGTAAWKSKTHYPNNDKTAPEMDLARDGRRVRKTGRAEEIASL